MRGKREVDDLLEKFVLELTNVPDYKQAARRHNMILERSRALRGLEGTVTMLIWLHLE